MDENVQNEKFRITLTVEQLRYGMFCKRADEKVYRDAAGLVNDKLLRYRAKFPAKSLVEYLTMTALHVSAQNVRIRRMRDKTEIFDSLKRMSGELDAFIAQND
jgi:cell division protein ZapA (FtsZ GTPase activity inhibitor)